MMEIYSYKTPNLGLRDPAFCANPFGCRAGAEPWRLQRERLIPGSSCVALCQACRDTAGHGRPRLMPGRTLYRHITECPMCHWLFGHIPPGATNHTIQMPDFQCWADIWAAEHQRKSLDATPCPICSFIPYHMGDIATRIQKRTLSRLPGIAARISIETFMDILRLARDRHTRDELQNFIRIHVEAGNPASAVNDIIQIIRRLTQNGTLSRDVLIKKLSAHHRYHSNCHDIYSVYGATYAY